MTVKKAEFVTSVAGFERYRELIALSAGDSDNPFNAPELCVAGRSNVGKSSFINMLAGRKGLAKTSSNPGHTRLINFFDFNGGEFLLTDLPGYGYAAASKSEKEKWGKLIEDYLLGSEKLLQVLLLVDVRHEPAVLDRQMVSYMYYYNLPFTVVATKCDKLSRSQLLRQVQILASSLKVGRDNVIPTSAVSGMGKDKVLERIGQILTAEETQEFEN